MAASEWYVQNNIPKVRWMHPGGNYKARCVPLGLTDLAAILYVHVLESNADQCVAFADDAMQREIGIMHVRNFEKIAILERVTAPSYRSIPSKMGTYMGTYMDRIEQTEAARTDDTIEYVEQMRLF